MTSCIAQKLRTSPDRGIDIYESLIIGWYIQRHAGKVTCRADNWDKHSLRHSLEDLRA